ARNGQDFDIYLMDPADPSSVELVLEADGEFWPLAWSPDGRYIALTRYLSHTHTALYLLDVETKSLERLLAQWGDAVSFQAVEWSHDGRHLFFSSDHDAEFHRLLSYELATGTVAALTQDIGWDVIDLELTPDGTRIAFLVNEDSAPTLWVLDLASGAPRRVDGAPSGFVRAQLGFEGLYMHPRHARVALDINPASGATSVYSYDLDDSRWSRWTQPAADETERRPVEIVRYPTFDLVDGTPREVPAAVFRPAASFEPPYPVLIVIHGGPAAQAGPVLPRPFAIVVDGGAVVIQPNVRGSSGYGKSYMALDDGPLREDAVRDIGALLDWVGTQPDLDPERVAVMGASYGGYMTLAALTHYSDRLRCGIDMFGFSNLVTFLKASEEHHFPDAQRAEFGDERDPETRAFLESISPLSHAERITVPLMIYQGANDVRIKPQESRQMVERIRSTGGTVHYIEAADEGHDLSRPLNLLYVGAAYGDLLNECLFGGTT
ncbi:MAG: prolyl oligopeptidase family serine peptidase, partial [Acidobacteria bacterium]|nr:prolyl oligopeptidase family serine peptidase [Acidobacteriota bacterium]